MTEQTPSIFNLRDIVVPEPVGFWPPATGVWVLVGVACIGLALLIWRGYAFWKARAYRRAGLARLAKIEGQLVSPGSQVAALRELSILLKRVALAAFPREQVEVSRDAGVAVPVIQPAGRETFHGDYVMTVVD